MFNMMKDLNAINGKFTLEEFEKKIPSDTILKQVRLKSGLVCFACGYDSMKKIAIVWSNNGKAYGRCLCPSKHDKRMGSQSIIFNGWVYFRITCFDLM